MPIKKNACINTYYVSRISLCRRLYNESQTIPCGGWAIEGRWFGDPHVGKARLSVKDLLTHVLLHISHYACIVGVMPSLPLLRARCVPKAPGFLAAPLCSPLRRSWFIPKAMAACSADGAPSTSGARSCNVVRLVAMACCW